MNTMKWLMIAAVFQLSFVVVHSAVAQPTVDGTLDVAEYGAALSVQTVQTQFGDNQSELNAAYATINGGNLYLMITGNIEGNFNKIQLFIDSVAGGQNSIDAVNNPQNFDSNIGEGFGNGWNAYVNRGLTDSPAPIDQAQEGAFTFDQGFEADYAMLFRRGNAGPDIFDVDFAVMGQTAIAADELGDIFGGSQTGTSGPLAINGGTAMVAYDDSNMAGIAGGTEAADQTAALAVTTGLEFSIPLASIGNPTGDIKVSAFINGSNHDFLSNQFLGGLLPAEPSGTQGNLGSDGNGEFLSGDADGPAGTGPDGMFNEEDDFDGDLFDGPGGLGADALGVGLVDLNNFAGDQFFTIPNAPTAGADLDGDGDVDGTDFLMAQRANDPAAAVALWESEYPSPLSALGAVPEPSSALLFAVGTLAMALRRRS